ncbi:uncharacterized protein [Halyomorpha halys]
MNETSSAFARERANKHEKSRSDHLLSKDSSRDGKLKNSDNALVPFKPPQIRPNENQPGRNLETFRHEYLTQPRTFRNRPSVDSVQIQQEGIVYSWMVDHQVQNERLIFRRMGFRRRELNRSLDDGLATESPRNSFTSSRSSGSKKDRSSGIFSLFQWFKKQKSEDSSDLEVSSGLNSPELPRSTSITGSVDTLFSTATANSFAFVHPLQYKPFGLANQPEIRIAVGPETNTYRNRIRERERLRYLEKNISLREKYRLYASGTLPRSADHINELSDYQILDVKQSFDHLPGSKYSTLGRKKRKAPPPPVSNSSNSENSLPAAVNQHFNEGILIKQHRRASSEPVKYIKLCHVKGKRRAPQPPARDNSTDTDIVSLSTTNTNSSKRSKKKRRAPSPPIKKPESDDEHIVHIIREATDNILADKNSEQQKEDFRDETISNASTLDIGSSDDVVCTDTLKLERGILKQNMEKPFSESRICPSSPVSPRPWYKRTTVNKEMFSAKEKEKRNERDRKKVEEWMLESGFPRRSLLNTDNKYSFFSKAEKSDEKRKSQISILTNISELDREAAEIIRRGKEKEKSLMESQNAMYFNDNGVANENEIVVNNISENEEPPRKNSAKELISLFNAITNVTKVTVNSSFFSKDTSNLFNKEREKRSEVLHSSIIIEKEQSRSSSSSTRDAACTNEVLTTKIISKNGVGLQEHEKPGTSFPVSNSSSEGKIARVTIDELDEFDAERNSKSQVLYEANRQNRHLSPPIPTITEVSESSAKSSPTSTIGSSNTSELPPEPPSEPVHMKHMHVWVCPRCTLENLRWRITCEACDMWRPNPFELRERSKQNKTLNNTTENQDKCETSVKGAPSSHLYPNLTKFTRGNKEENTSNAPSQGSTCNSIINKKEIQDVKYTKNADQEKSLEQKIKLEDIGVGSDRLEKDQDKKNMKIKEEEQQQAEEIRKARLAFFNKGNSEGTPSLEKDKAIVKTDKTLADKTSIVKSDIVPAIMLDSTPVKTETSSVIKANKTPLVKVEAILGMKSDTSSVIVKTDDVPIIKEDKTLVSKDINKSTIVITNDDDEKRKLKEMLIEMKHSLPKRPKPFKKTVESNIATANKIDKASDHPSPTPQITKSSASTSTYSNIIPNTIKSHENEAEAYLVESECVIEEIKIKKPSEKVSSSVQTSGLVKQISPKPKISSGKEIFIPIKVEEHLIKDGILYTSVSKDTRRIGTGTFELLRPRDFANIEAIKTESKSAPVHLYANVADNEDGEKNLKTEETPLNSSAYIDKLSKQLTKPQGVAHFKARLDMSNDKNLNTLAINRLLKRLEVAIAGGNHELAATLARELAQLKVNCSVIRQKSETPGNEILVEMYVEDKVSHQGPFPMKISPTLTVKDLKDKIEREYEIPADVQRWILGKQLAANDGVTLDNMGINKDGCPIFLYLVAPPEIAQSKTTTDSGVLLTKLKLPTINSTINIDITERDLQEAGPSGINIKTTPEKIETVPKIVEDITVVSESQSGLNPIGTLALGWKCEICTLMNSPTRPGCAACTTERPKDYKVPAEYKLSEAEILRIDNEKVTEEKSTKADEEEKAKNYQKLVDLEKDDIIIYPEAFECPVCLTDYSPMEGVVLRECLHVFCRNCISNTIQFSEEAEVKCPFRDNNYTCDSTLLQREIKAIVPPEVYEEHLAKSIALAETKIGNAFHCKTPDCKGWCIYEDNVNTFHCPVCTHINCLTCQAIHEGLNCKQFQEQLNTNSDMNIEAKRTKEMLQEMVDRGEAMNCPTCQVVLMKKWGCDWLRCSMCKTEICWVTRGPRWGPNGKGDTSGGCQCGVNGVKCHPKCTYCH